MDCDEHRRPNRLLPAVQLSPVLLRSFAFRCGLSLSGLRGTRNGAARLLLTLSERDEYRAGGLPRVLRQRVDMGVSTADLILVVGVLVIVVLFAVLALLFALSGVFDPVTA